MARPGEDIYQFQDTPSLKSMPPQAALVPPPPRFNIPWSNLAIWAAAAIFVGLVVVWAGVAGMRLRGQLWRSTRSIHFAHDTDNAMRYGGGAIREAEKLAGLQPFADAKAPDDSATDDFRRLTSRELLAGMVKTYGTVIAAHPDGNYGLDYPPLRLTVMTLWARHVQRANSSVVSFPLAEKIDDPLHEKASDFADPTRTHDTLLGQREDVAEPLLKFNAACEAVAAGAIFALVWLWVVRSARGGGGVLRAVPAGGGPALRRIIPPGIVTFAVATAGFWYALLTLATPPLRPAPIIDLQRVASQQTHADVYASVLGQGLRTFCRVDWGESSIYGHSTPVQAIPAIARQSSPAPVHVRLDGLPAGQVVHYRLVAYNGQGSTSSRDEEFVAGGPTVTLPSRPIGGGLWPDWTVWMRLGAIFLAMVISARLLPPLHRGWACGLIAALLVWFNPIALIDAHVWPQWDAWILPFIVLALLAASLDAWILVGAIIGAGCLLKGQLLLGAPVLLAWPLFSGRIANALRLLAGFAAAAGAILSPWLLSYDSIVFHDACRWIVSAMVAAAIVAALSLARGLIWRQRKAPPPQTEDELKNQPFVEAVAGPAAWTGRQIWWPGVTIVSAAAVIGAIASLILLFANWPGQGGRLIWAMAALLALVAILPWVLRRPLLPLWAVAVFAASIWLAAFAFVPDRHNFDWWKVAFEYGSVKDERPQQGVLSFANFPAILAQRFGWKDLHEPAWKIHLDLSLPRPIRFAFVRDYQMELRSVLVMVYALCVVACGAAAAFHSRRRDARALLAVVVPWVIFPLILGQMSERYLLWGSALTAVCIAVSTGLVLLHVLLAVAGAGMMLHQLLDRDPGRWLGVHDFFGRLYPDFGWAMVLIGAIFLWSALVPSRRGVTRL